jgi:hypothetical protein
MILYLVPFFSSFFKFLKTSTNFVDHIVHHFYEVFSP